MNINLSCANKPLLKEEEKTNTDVKLGDLMHEYSINHNYLGSSMPNLPNIPMKIFKNTFLSGSPKKGANFKLSANVPVKTRKAASVEKKPAPKKAASMIGITRSTIIKKTKTTLNSSSSVITLSRADNNLGKKGIRK